MRRKVAAYILILVLVAGGYYILSNFPRESSSILLNNGTEISLSLNENILSMRDPVVAKKITVDYKGKEIIHRSHYDDYDYRIYLIKVKKDTVWSLEESDGTNNVQCSATTKKTLFAPVVKDQTTIRSSDTLIRIDYSNFKFDVKFDRSKPRKTPKKEASLSPF